MCGLLLELRDVPSTSGELLVLVVAANQCWFPFSYKGLLFYQCAQNSTTRCDVGCYIAPNIWATCAYNTLGLSFHFRTVWSDAEKLAEIASYKLCPVIRPLKKGLLRTPCSNNFLLIVNWCHEIYVDFIKFSSVIEQKKLSSNSNHL